MEQQTAPVELRVVAWLFVFTGVCAVIEMVSAVADARLSLNFGVLGFWIGRGLLRYEPRWRTWALVFGWIGIGALVLGTALVAWTDAPVQYRIGPWSGRAPDWYWFLIAPPVAVVAGWPLWVLTRPEIRARFETVTEPPSEVPA